MTMTMLTRTAEPGISYMINDAQKTYARIDVKEMQKNLAKSEQEKKWTVKRLGSDKVAGFACEKALVSQEGSTSENEVCVSKEILIPASIFDAQRRGAAAQSLQNALKANGLEGMPIRMVMKEKGEAGAHDDLGAREGREALSRRRRRSRCRPGYKETSMMGTMVSPEQQKQMQEAHEEPDARAAEDDRGDDEEEGRQPLGSGSPSTRNPPPPALSAAVPSRSGKGLP